MIIVITDHYTLHQNVSKIKIFLNIQISNKNITRSHIKYNVKHIDKRVINVLNIT